MPTIDQAVAAYILLRDQKEALAKEHKAQLAPFREKMDKIETWLLAILNKQGAESTRTDSGTAYKTTRTAAKVVDWETVLDFMLKNDMLHMLEHRVSKSAVEEYLAAQGECPPGVTITQDTGVNVRR